jgi:hypothetical protein
MCQPRSDALPGKSLRDLGMQQHDAAILFLIIRDGELILDRQLETVHRGVVDDLVHLSYSPANRNRRSRALSRLRNLASDWAMYSRVIGTTPWRLVS